MSGRVAARGAISPAGGLGGGRPVAILTAVAVTALLALLAAPALALAQQADDSSGSFAERPDEYAGIVDEDEQFAPPAQEYAFNPVQARKELKVGNYYAKKGSYRAAAGRFEEASRWDSSFAEAYWRLGMAREKLDLPREAMTAYARFLSIEPEGKRARSVRKRMEELRRSAGDLPLSAQDSER